MPYRCYSLSAGKAHSATPLSRASPNRSYSPVAAAAQTHSQLRSGSRATPTPNTSPHPRQDCYSIRLASDRRPTHPGSRCAPPLRPVSAGPPRASPRPSTAHRSEYPRIPRECFAPFRWLHVWTSSGNACERTGQPGKSGGYADIFSFRPRTLHYHDKSSVYLSLVVSMHSCHRGVFSCWPVCARSNSCSRSRSSSGA